MKRAAIGLTIGFAVALAMAATGAQLTGGGGLTKVVLDSSTSNIATGSGTTAAPLLVAITKSSSGSNLLTGTGSAGSGLLASLTTSAEFTGTGSAGSSLTLGNSGVSAGTYTLATIVVDAKGRVTSATVGASAAHGEFGDGSDGSVTMDGSSTVACATRSGSTYTANRSCFYQNLTINVGVIWKPDGWPQYVNGTLTNNGDINANGGDASGATNGALAISGSRLLPVNMSVGNNSTAAPQVFVAASAANGGASVGGAGSNGGNGTAGTTGRGGGGGAGGNNNPFTAQGAAGNNSPTVALAPDAQGDVRTAVLVFRGSNWSSTLFTPGTAGANGGAGGAGTTGGGVGSAGGWIALAARTYTGSGTCRAKGGVGGVGTLGGAGIGGAGGGGGGAGGLFALKLNGGTPPTCDVSGGAGGNGGAGGSGPSGSGGTGGAGGTGVQINLN